MSFDDLKPLTNEEMGVNSVIYTGLLEEQLVFIKIGSDPRHFRVETSALDLLHRHNVPTPRILAFTERASFINRPLMIQTAAEGIPLNRINPEKDRLQIWELAGKTLKQIHAIQIEGFGKLDVEQGKLSGELTSWKEWVAQAKKRTDYLVEHEFITQDETEKKKKQKKQKRSIEV